MSSSEDSKSISDIFVFDHPPVNRPRHRVQQAGSEELASDDSVSLPTANPGSQNQRII